MTQTATDLSGIAELAHWGVIRVAGEEAVKFLQAQLTQDVALLKPEEARLAAFCNAKGRMQASFIMFKRGLGAEQDVMLVCNRDILAQTLKRLSMFVMRAKAKLSDATGEFKLYGVVGNAIESIAATNLKVWDKADIDDTNLVMLHPGAGQPLALWCVPASTPLPAASLAPLIDVAVWHWLSVQSGIALITLPIFEAFVPQMLNYESVGGVSFKKGCYPGQEIVARSQFRGTLKRRAYLVHGEGADTPLVGHEVFHASDTGQPCGQVAASAASPAGGFAAIVSMQTSAANTGKPESDLSLGSAEGTRLTLQALPYALLEDI